MWVIRKVLHFNSIEFQILRKLLNRFVILESLSLLPLENRLVQTARHIILLPFFCLPGYWQVESKTLRRHFIHIWHFFYHYLVVKAFQNDTCCRIYLVHFNLIFFFIWLSFDLIIASLSELLITIHRLRCLLKFNLINSYWPLLFGLDNNLLWWLRFQLVNSKRLWKCLIHLTQIRIASILTLLFN